MGNEITVPVSIRINQGQADGKDWKRDFGKRQIDQNATGFVHHTQNIGVTAEALYVGDLTTPGWFMALNWDANKEIEVGVVDSAGTFYPTASLQGGEPASFRLATAAPYARHTSSGGTAQLEYVIAED
jgi:hypothetical protein